jgi:hypothetical protein
MEAVNSLPGPSPQSSPLPDPTWSIASPVVHQSILDGIAHDYQKALSLQQSKPMVALGLIDLYAQNHHLANMYKKLSVCYPPVV